jgi:hypothetical protein
MGGDLIRIDQVDSFSTGLAAEIAQLLKHLLMVFDLGIGGSE